MKVTKIFPLRQFPIQIHIVFVAQQLIEFPFVGSVGTFYLAIESWCLRLDVDMMDSPVCEMPVKLSLELVTVICPDRVNPKRELG